MKSELNGVDVHVIVRELEAIAVGSRVDKVYHLSEKELLLRVYRTGVGVMDLIITPKYLCLTKYSRSAPETPSSFAMQLRKMLEGGFVRTASQRDFDRIVEFEFDVKGARYFLVAEFFSTGNVFLLDAERKILGLLEWQKWKDRTLGVGRVYEYPPEVANPLKLSKEDFSSVKSGGKGVAAAIAGKTSLGGFYAEEICLRAGVDRKKKSEELSLGEVEALWTAFLEVVDSIEKGEAKPIIVYENGAPVDVAPFEAWKLRPFERKGFESFNEAVDEYFSSRDNDAAESLVKGKTEGRREMLETILAQQHEALGRMRRDADLEKKKGDAVYARYGELEEIARFIRQERSKGVSDDEITEQLKSKAVFKSLEKYELTVEL